MFDFGECPPEKKRKEKKPIKMKKTKRLSSMLPVPTLATGKIHSSPKAKALKPNTLTPGTIWVKPTRTTQSLRIRQGLNKLPIPKPYLSETNCYDPGE